jgi:hypothetical protein
MIHVVAMKRLTVLPLLMHIELLWRSRSFKNRGVGVLKIEESQSELLCTDSTALLRGPTYQRSPKRYFVGLRSRFCEPSPRFICATCWGTTSMLTIFKRSFHTLLSVLPTALSPKTLVWISYIHDIVFPESKAQLNTNALFLQINH